MVLLLLVLMEFRHSIMALRCRFAASAAAWGRGSPFHSLSHRRRHSVVSGRQLQPNNLLPWGNFDLRQSRR